MGRLVRRAALLAVVLVGCAPGGSQTTFSAEDLEQMPQFQRDILVDGVVTPAEYESSIVAQRDCVAAAGYEPGEIQRTGGLLGFETTADYSEAADPDAADTEFLATLDGCEAEYVTYVGTVWTASLAIDDPAERDRVRQQLADCLVDGGLTVPGEATDEDLAQIMQNAATGDDVTLVGVVQSCAEQHGNLFIKGQ